MLSPRRRWFGTCIYLKKGWNVGNRRVLPIAFSLWTGYTEYICRWKILLKAGICGMETDKLVFCRHFSALGPFQQESQLWYELSGVLNAEQTFCVHLCHEEACGRRGMRAYICATRRLARQFLRFLYENAIEPEQLPALVHDFGLLRAGEPEGGVGA